MRLKTSTSLPMLHQWVMIGTVVQILSTTSSNRTSFDKSSDE